MNIKKLFAGVLVGAMVVGCMAVSVGADSSVTGGTVTVDADPEWEAFRAFTKEEVLGDSGVKIGAVTSVTFSSDSTDDWYAVYANEDGDWTQVEGPVTFYAEDAYLGDFVTSIAWGNFGVWNISSSANDFTCTLTYTDTYTDENSITKVIGWDDVVNNSSYILTLQNSDGKTAYLEGNTYSVGIDENDTDYFWIGVSMSDIPYDQEVEIIDIEFVK